MTRRVLVIAKTECMARRKRRIKSGEIIRYASFDSITDKEKEKYDEVIVIGKRGNKK